MKRKSNHSLIVGLVLLLTLFSTGLYAQITLEGTVTDSDGFGISDVKISEVANPSNTVYSDLDGNYEITVPENAIVAYQADGLKEVRLTAKANTNPNISLRGEQELDELVVVGYGVQSKESLTGSVTEITSADLENRPVTNLSSAFEGFVPGAQFTSASGQPGSGQSLVLRGFSSLNGNVNPLYVIDGVIGGNIGLINPADVESVSFLKDAASTAIYGNRAANGVIIVTTKQGKKNSSSFSFNVSQGFTQRAIPEYDRLNDRDFMEYTWDAIRNSQITDFGDATQFGPAGIFASENLFATIAYNPYVGIANNEIVDNNGRINPNARLVNPSNYDWSDGIERTGFRQNYDFSFRGGSENTTYAISLNYLNEEGYILNSDYERYLANIRVVSDLTPWLNVTAGINGQLNEGNIAATAGNTSFVNPFRSTRNMGPIYPIFEVDPATGQFLLDENGERIFAVDTPRGSDAANGRHVIAETLFNRNTADQSEILSNVAFRAKFLRDFSATVSANHQLRNSVAYSYDNRIVGDGAPNGRLDKSSTLATVFTFNQILEYNKSIGDFNINALVGHEYNEQVNNFLRVFKSNQVVDGIFELPNFTTVQVTDSFESKATTESYFGRIVTDFANKYFLSGSIRQDETSRYSGLNDARVGYFWSVGGSWIVSRENFMQNLEFLNNLKLRASYGTTGNVGGFFDYLGLYDLGLNNNGIAGAAQNSLQNDALTWETQRELSLGLDFGLFNNRVSGSVEYFKKTNEDLQLFLDLAFSDGYDGFNLNIADMENRGVELLLSVDVIRNKDFDWNLTFTGATINNEILSLAPEFGITERIVGTKRWEAGVDRFAYYLRDWRGVDSTDGAGLYDWDPTLSDANIRIIDGDTLTTDPNAAIFRYTGTSALPDFYGSVRTGFRYKSFDLSAVFTYSFGGQVYDANYQGLMAADSEGGAVHQDILGRWRAPGDISEIPRADLTFGRDFNVASDRWLIDADYWAIRSVRLGYNLPKSFLESMNIKGFYTYLSGENLYFSSERRGLDSQNNFSGVTDNSFSPARTFTMGVNLNF